MPMMMSLIDARINSLSGHCFPITANEAIWIPPVVVREAIALGMTVVDDQPPKVMEAPVKTDDNVQDEFTVELDQAILRILTRNDESDFKTDGTPKVARVIAEMDPKCRRATASEVTDVYERLKDRVNLAE